MADNQTKSNHQERSVDIAELSTTAKIESDTYAEATKGYRVFPLNQLVMKQNLPADIFVPLLDQELNTVVMTKVFSKNKPLLNKDKGYLINLGVSKFYIKNDQFADFVAYKNKYAHRALNKPNLPPVVKSELLYENATLVIQEAMGSERLGENIAMGVDYIKDLTDFITSDPENIQSISEFLAVDYSLYTHSVNVCLLLTSFAHYLGLPKKQIITLGVGALYHDIGKRKIPEAILNKPDKLDDTEWLEMKKHTVYGYNLLRTSANLDPIVLKMALHHHENIDGSGYPNGRTGDELDTPSKIIKIIDVYDALTSKRVYKPAMTPMEAIGLIVKRMSAHVSADLLKKYTTFLGWMVSGPLAKARMKRGALS
jgi:putative nucleotidyltransferase with HDIG domain